MCLAVTKQGWHEQSQASRTGSLAAEMLLSKLGTAQVWFVPPPHRGCPEVDTAENVCSPPAFLWEPQQDHASFLLIALLLPHPGGRNLPLMNADSTSWYTQRCVGYPQGGLATEPQTVHMISTGMGYCMGNTTTGILLAGKMK